MRKSRLIPFSWTPASWGLRGPQREEAEAAYYYEGLELDRRLAEIRHRDDPHGLAAALARIDHRHGLITNRDLAYRLVDADPTLKTRAQREQAKAETDLEQGTIEPYEYDLRLHALETWSTPDEQKLAFLAIEHKHGKLTERAYDEACVEIEYPEEGIDRDLAMLDVKLKHREITQHDYNKERATLLEEPWIGVLNMGFDADKGLGGIYMEFDWNEYWIIYLRMNGYTGLTDEQVVDMWFGDVCRAQGLAAMQQPLYEGGTVIPFSGRAVNRNPEE